MAEVPGLGDGYVGQLRVSVRVFGSNHPGNIPDGIHAVQAFHLVVAVRPQPVAAYDAGGGDTGQGAADDAGGPDEVPGDDGLPPFEGDRIAVIVFHDGVGPDDDAQFFQVLVGLGLGGVAHGV